jgi:hypothetical protein
VRAGRGEALRIKDFFRGEFLRRACGERAAVHKKRGISTAMDDGASCANEVNDRVVFGAKGVEQNP